VVSWRALAAASALAFVACSGDDEDAALRSAVEDHSTILCERLFSCCTEAELGEIPFVDEKSPPTQDGCVAYHRKVGESYLPATKAATARIDLGRSEACATETRSLPCADLRRRLLAIHLGDAFLLCQSAIVTAESADGAPCESYLDCASGYCAARTCRPLPGTGDPCPTDECASGLRCAPTTRTCEPLVAKGGTCASDDACVSGACRDGRCVSPGLCGG